MPNDLKFDTAVTVNVKAIRPKWQGKDAPGTRLSVRRRVRVPG